MEDADAIGAKVALADDIGHGLEADIPAECRHVAADDQGRRRGAPRPTDESQCDQQDGDQDCGAISSFITPRRKQLAQMLGPTSAILCAISAAARLTSCFEQSLGLFEGYVS